MATLNDILEELIEPAEGGFSQEHAQYVLGIKFSEEMVRRYQDLASRNQEGELTPDEKNELKGFATANSILMILKLKARRSLMQHAPAA